MIFRKQSDIPVWWLPQPGPQTYAAVCPVQEILFYGSRGGGKQLPDFTQVLCQDGFKRIDELTVGDLVYSSDGTLYPITGIYPQGKKTVYRLILQDGREVLCGDGHLWSVVDRGLKPCVMSTIDMLKAGIMSGNPGKTSYAFRVPNCEPVEFEEHPLPIDPYILGCLIGEGTLTTKTPKIATSQSHILNRLKRLYSEFEVQLDTSTTNNHTIVDRNKGGKPFPMVPKRSMYSSRNRFTEAIEFLGMNVTCKNKFIPEMYKWSSVEQRMELLRGLMDTDGSVGKTGCSEFTSASETLIHDVAWLCRSLGIRCRLSVDSRRNRKIKIRGKEYNSGLIYRLYINTRLFISKKPESIKRLQQKPHSNRDKYISIVDIQKLRYKTSMTCIAVDSPDHTYLIEGFVVTHNTQAAIGRQVRGAAKWGPQWNGLMIRKKYKQLAGLRRDFDELIRNGMPAERVGGDRETNYIRFSNKAVITLASIPDLKTAGDYQGHGITEVSIEEAAEYAFIAELIDRMQGALRSGGGVPSSMFMTGNPGGPGAAPLKAMFMTKDDGSRRKPKKVFKSGGISRVYIPSNTIDNKILMANDPTYLERLESIKDPILRKAWLDGDVDIVIGRAFTLHPKNIMEPIWPIPPHVPIIMGFDWGHGAPFSVGWYWVDERGGLIRFAEWYGMAGINQPNKGLRLTDKQIAHGILEREHDMRIGDRRITRLAGHDCANKKPNYTTGMPGPSTVEEFIEVANDQKTRSEFGDVDLTLITRKPDKLDKMKQFRERLYVSEDPKEFPMLRVYSSCKQFIRIIPTLSMDDTNQEQLEKGQEDHIFDETSLVCMSRPIGLTDHDLEKIRLEEKRRNKPKVDSVSEAAAQEFRDLVKQMEGDWDWDADYHRGIGIN